MIIDERTLAIENGLYARILTDIDLSRALPGRILVKRQQLNFFVRLEYEKLPGICANCGAIGHVVESCRKRGGERHKSSSQCEESREDTNRAANIGTVQQEQQVDGGISEESTPEVQEECGSSIIATVRVWKGSRLEQNQCVEIMSKLEGRTIMQSISSIIKAHGIATIGMNRIWETQIRGLIHKMEILYSLPLRTPLRF